jgi:hypothetical protein
MFCGLFCFLVSQRVFDMSAIEQLIEQPQPGISREVRQEVESNWLLDTLESTGQQISSVATDVYNGACYGAKQAGYVLAAPFVMFGAVLWAGISGTTNSAVRAADVCWSFAEEETNRINAENEKAKELRVVESEVA